LGSDTLTAQYIKGKKTVLGKKKITKREDRRGKFLQIIGADENNLQKIDVDIPENFLTVVCGVSGSGKSTLVDTVIYPYLANRLMHAKRDTGKVRNIKGTGLFDSIYYVDQSPIGTSSRSNPATFIGVFDDIRKIYAMLGESKKRGYSANRFSFNSKEGRCEKCQGLGTIKVEMHFMPDIYIICDICQGKRYKKDTLEVQIRNKDISDILDMTFGEAEEFFTNYPHVKRKMSIMNRVGLEYLKLGQPAPTLSGGEAQRLKIAFELGKKSAGKTLYILDEPTSGLHFHDISKLLYVIRDLVSMGNTLIIIEHNTAVIKSADYIVELGPGGGDEGGNVVFQGFIGDFLNAKTATAKCLRE
ncbi:hypothetical protein ACFL6D_00425, partial [Spirochaetota bacterium]